MSGIEFTPSVGELRHRITIEVRDTAKDTFGQQVTTWTKLLAGVPARIETLSGRELIAARAKVAEVTHEITVRYHPALANPIKVGAMRATFIDRRAGITHTYELFAGLNVGHRNKWIVIPCAEGLTQG